MNEVFSHESEKVMASAFCPVTARLLLYWLYEEIYQRVTVMCYQIIAEIVEQQPQHQAQ